MWNDGTVGRTKIRAVYNAGTAAAAAGLPESKCPYSATIDRLYHASWRMGWSAYKPIVGEPKVARSRDYDYKPSYEGLVDRAERKGSMFDSLFKDAKLYRPKQGANLLRILPPGWPKASHYGLTVMVHRGVGPNDRQYLCLRENPGSPHKRCPVCEELYRLGQKASQEDRQILRPKSSVVYYVIDRDNEKDGVQIWMTSPTTDSEIAAQSVNHRTKSWINIVDPDDGYDIEFTRTGTTRNNTRYRGFQVMREPSPLADNTRLEDEWLDIAFDKPLSSLLQFYTPEHIEEVFYGTAKEDDKTADDDRPRARDRDDDRGADREEPRRTRGRDDDEERPSRSRSRTEEPNDEERPPRSRSRADEPPVEDEERPARRERARPRDDETSKETPHRATRDDGDNRDNDARNETRRTGRDPDDDAPQAARARARMDKELDDEIPEHGSRPRSNGHAAAAAEDEAPFDRGARRRSAPENDTEQTRPADTARRERMRERLNRED